MELTQYSWWGESNEPPPHLKTKKQLGELGLSPLKPSGVIPTRKYDVLLYDIHNPESCRPKRKPSPKQLETLAANRLKAQIIKILNYCCQLHSLPSLMLTKRSECLMEWAAQWRGNWSSYYKDYRYLSLNGGHRALGDCMAAFEFIKRMAADSDQINCPVPLPQKNS